MDEKQEVSAEFVTYIKERDAAREEVKQAKSELQETQSRLYDALQQIDKLTAKLKDAEDGKSKSKSSKKKASKTPPVQNGGLKPSNATSPARASTAMSERVDSAHHPPVSDVDPNADSVEYYWKLAEKFPLLPMYLLLDAEKKFMKADTDNSGTIDLDELDKVLSDTIGMLTPPELKKIFKEVDVDDNDSLDFSEVLVIVNKLSARRKTNLPPNIQQNYSKTCSIQ